MFEQKFAFFRHALPPIGAFRTFLGPVTKNIFLKIEQRRDPLGQQGSRIPEKGCLLFVFSLNFEFSLF